MAPNKFLLELYLATSLLTVVLALSLTTALELCIFGTTFLSVVALVVVVLVACRGDIGTEDFVFDAFFIVGAFPGLFVPCCDFLLDFIVWVEDDRGADVRSCDLNCVFGCFEVVGDLRISSVVFRRDLCCCCCCC